MCGSEHEYLHQLAAAVRSVLGPATYVYTTDPPWLVTKGSMPGTEIYTCGSDGRHLYRLNFAPASIAACVQ